MEYTFLEWNIQGAGGGNNYKIPKFITNTILEKKPDIVVLVEFFIGQNFDYIRQQFEEDYSIFISPFAYKHNQVLIALKKDKFKEENIKNVITNNIMDQECPEYLQVDIDKEGKKFSIIGARIKTGGSKNDRKKQFSFLDNKFKILNKVICIGDFNVTVENAQHLFNFADVYAPRIVDYDSSKIVRWSFVHKNRNKVGIDLIVSKNILISKDVEDDLSKQGKYKMYANYDWGFISDENGYAKLSSDDYITEFTGKPNHAILIGKFTV